MDIEYIGSSKTQPIDPKLETKQRTRAAAIIYRMTDTGEKEYLLRKNTNPLLNVTTFPLISSEHVNTAFLTVYDGMKAIQRKTGYTLISCLDSLVEVQWTFRKPTENYNEDTLVKGFVFSLDSEEKMGTIDTSDEILRKTTEQLEKELRSDGSNGSSYLLWQRYKDTVAVQKDILSDLSEQTKKTIEKMSEGGADSLRIVTDFDSTLTDTIFHSNNSPVNSLIALLRTGGYLSDNYATAAHNLFNHYNPLNHDLSIPVNERRSLMHERWSKHFDLIIAEGVTKSNISTAVENAGIKRRDGIHAFFTNAHKLDIPVIILSAGITDMIEVSLQKYGLLTPNVHIVANKFIYDEQDRIIGVEEPIIHSLNKDEHACKNFERSEGVSTRKNVILMGDGLGDIHMVDLSQGDTVFSVGFFTPKAPSPDQDDYDQKQAAYLKNKQSYNDSYDSVETGSARLPLAVLEQIVSGQ